jgi:protocatechuate 3,4-dioxygenase beta subunit
MLTARSEGMIGQVPFAKKDAYTLRLAKAATVSGRVTDSKTKVPVAGVIVRAAIPRLGRGDALATETDAKGAYSIVVPAGSYLVFTFRPGYDASNADVTVAPGQQVTRELAIPQLARVSGTVLDEEKRPVVAANVAPVNAGDPSREGVARMMRSTNTVFSGPDGRFSTTVFPDEPVFLTATKRGFPAARSEQLRAASGERKRGVVLTIPGGIAVGGRVSDKDGNPLSGVAVIPLEPDEHGYRMMTFNARQAEDDAIRTAADGTYTLRVAEGKYDFSFRREGFAPKTVRGQSITVSAPARVDATMEPAVAITGRVLRGGNGLEGLSVTVVGDDSRGSAVTGPDGSFTISGLAPGSMRALLRKEDAFIQESRTLTAPAQDVVIELPGGGRVTGRVFDKAAGKPLTSFQAGIAISRGMGGRAMMSPPQLREFSNEDGTFALDNVPPGTLFVVASAPGYVSARLNVTVEEGKTAGGLELRLETGVQLTGRVTGPDGTPLGDVTVRADASDAGAFMTWGPETTAVTDANGEYSLETLSPGDATISFAHADYVPSRKQVMLKGGETKLDVQLSAGRRVTGVVVTEEGVPVADAQVSAHGAGINGGSARTAANGTFEMDALPAGRYRFSASKPGASGGSVDDVDISSQQQVRITMHAGATISGRIIGLAPEELALVKIEAYAERGSVTGSADSSGNYRLQGAPTGSVTIYAEVGSYGSSLRTSPMRTVDVAPGASETVDLTFRNDITIRGRVVRDGKPLPGAHLTFLPKDGSAQTYGSTSTNEQGVYSLGGLEEGEYEVTATDNGRSGPYSTAYTVRGSATFDIEYRTGSIRGSVVDAETSEPLAYATVMVRPSGQRNSYSFMSPTVSSDAAGTFVAESIPPGSYSVTASKDGYASDVRQLTVSDRGEELHVKLSRGDAVLLRTVDGRSGQPVPARVWVYDAQNRLIREPEMFRGGTDDGEVKLPLAPGSYTTTVRANGYAAVNLRIQSPSPAVVIALTRGGTIRVKSKHAGVRRARLLDANGVVYQRFDFPMPSWELLPQPATTEVPSVAPGAYTLQLLGDGENVVDSVQVTVQEGGVTEAEI